MICYLFNIHFWISPICNIDVPPLPRPLFLLQFWHIKFILLVIFKSWQICDVLFLTNRAMLYHRATHLNERPFPCPHCQHAFKLKVGLTRHIKRIHTPGYVAKIRCRCPHCDKGFNANYFLQVHIRQVHTGERPFACDKEGCGKAYAENKALKLHLRKAHGIEIEPKIKSRLPKSKKMEVSEGGGDKD